MSRGAKIALAIVGVAVVALVIVVVVMVEHVDDGTKTLEKEVPFADLATFDAAVVLSAGAEANDVANALDASGIVTRFATLTPAELLLNVSFAPASESKRVAKQVCATPTTRSFAVALTDADTRQSLARAAGPSATLVEAWRHPDAEIFMQLRATPEQVDAVATRLQGDERVTADEFLDRDDAYAEFRRMFADRPELLTAEPGDLPESFRLTLRADVSPKTISDAYGRMPGVDSVMYPSKFSGTASPEARLRRVCAEALSPN